MMFILLSFVIWYFMSGFVASITGLSYLCRNPWVLPFYELYEDFKCLSKKYKANHIRQIVNSDIYLTPGQENCGAMCSSSGSWTYKEIRDNNLYEEVGMKMLPGWKNFLFLHCFVPFIGIILTLIFK